MQLLAEKGELPTRFGSATLGILLLQVLVLLLLFVMCYISNFIGLNMLSLKFWCSNIIEKTSLFMHVTRASTNINVVFQDIAVVPLLVILPVLESQVTKHLI